ncbi:MAG: hypothetical protein JO080_10225 [Mucilaginibacter sp.]|nr:hypothetical protein [Mucilaginibacter sp.]
MNIDELKDAWNKDDSGDMRLHLDTASLNKTTSVLGRLRKNMKAELISLLMSYVMIFAVLFWNVRSPLFFNITVVLLFSSLVITVFYFFRFYVFYKSIGRYDLSIANSIRKITYELELNTEIYKTYSFSAIPLSVLTALALIASKIRFDHLNNAIFTNSSLLPFGVMLYILATILLSFIITYVCINFHVRTSYGKYLTDLKQVTNDLGELS